MAVATVVPARDMRERPELGRRQDAVRNRDPQHRRVLLQVQPVLQAQRPELVLGQLARQEPSRLIAELGHSAHHEGAVIMIVVVHCVSLMIEMPMYR